LEADFHSFSESDLGDVEATRWQMLVDVGGLADGCWHI
jgi:hypothetical protein